MTPQLLCDSVADKVGVDRRLLRAIVATESAWNQWAMRFEPVYRWTLDIDKHAKACGITAATEEMCQKTSWGLCQVMGAVAREQGYAGPLAALTDPALSLTHGAKLLARLATRYTDPHDVIVSYNAGSPRRSPDGKYVNLEYLRRVLAEMERLKAAGF